MKPGGPYQHFYLEAAYDPSFPGSYLLKAIWKLEDLCNICQAYMEVPQADRVLAFDVETNSLDHTKGDLIGVALCFQPDAAYYLPLKHQIGANLPEGAIEYIEQLCYHATRVPMFNARFDLRWARKEGFDLSMVPYFDVAIPVWMTDTNRPNPDLKWAAKHFLGWNMIKYEAAVGSAEDLSFNDPILVAQYAAADALATWHLDRKLRHVYDQHQFVCDLDNRFIMPIMLMEDCPHPIEYGRLEELLKEAVSALDKVTHEAHRVAGRVFGIGSDKQVGELLLSLGLDTGIRTPSGKQMKVDEPALTPILDKHPIVGLILEYRGLEKLINTFITNLDSGYREGIAGGTGGCRFSYRLTRASTGRLSSAADKNNPYFTRVNVQAVTKPVPTKYVAERSNAPGNILGWVFHLSSEGKIEGFKQEMSLRRLFVPRPGHLFLHIDYKSQELRIPANLSGEPFLIDAFVNKKDLHREMAEYIWGADLAAEMRTAAKALNFGALYGGTKYTFARTIGCSPDEAQVYVDKWWNRMSYLDSWRRACWRHARKTGYITTVFGRPRRVRFYYSQKRTINYANRTVVNTQVQGAAADLIKIAMCRIYDKILTQPEHKGKIYPLSTVHDELNFSVLNDPEYFTQVTLQIQELMQIEVPGWTVPMLVEVSIGDSWGNIFPFEYRSGEWVPA